MRRKKGQKEREKRRVKEGKGTKERQIGEEMRVGNSVLVREPRLFPITNGAIREPAGGDYF